MKIALLFLCLLSLSFKGFAQDPQVPILYLYTKAYASAGCPGVTLKIQGDQVTAYSCHYLKIQPGEVGYNFPLQQENVLKKIYQMPTSALKNIERELIATNCDYAYSIQLMRIEQGQEEHIEWRRVQGCYTPKIRRMMKQVEKVLAAHQITIIYH